MDAEINNVIYMELYSGPKMVHGKYKKNERCEIDRSRFHCTIFCKIGQTTSISQSFPLIILMGKQNVKNNSLFLETSLKLLSIFFSGTGRCQRKFTQTLGEYAPLYATIKNWVAQFKRGIFPPVMRLVLDNPKQ
jgi:hypothetical protein